jgi:AhpD family alkylhydroperoxidase
MTPTYPAQRIQLDAVAPKPVAAIMRLVGSIELDRRLHELLSLRASQLNGCAFCIDMHWKNLRALGEGEERLYSLEAWRESPLYDEREQAALELCEAMTFIADGHVRDAVWARVRAEFTEPEAAQLVYAIAAINTWNRLQITSRAEPGHYQPGDIAAAA